MPQVWLPIKEPTTGREITIIIPGANQMDRGQLKEIIQWQTEKTLADLKAKGPQPVARFSSKEVGQALNEFRHHLERKGKTGNPKYF